MNTTLLDTQVLIDLPNGLTKDECFTIIGQADILNMGNIKEIELEVLFEEVLEDDVIVSMADDEYTAGDVVTVIRIVEESIIDVGKHIVGETLRKLLLNSAKKVDAKVIEEKVLEFKSNLTALPEVNGGTIS